MKKSILNHLIFSVLIVLSACDNKVEVFTREPYSWTVSPLSISGFHLLNLKIGSDGKLYAVGAEFDKTVFKTVFAKLDIITWEILSRVDEPGVADFAIFRDTVYYSTATAIKKTLGAFVEPVLATGFCSLETYHDKLIIARSAGHYNGAEYTTISYDAEGIFVQIDQGIIDQGFQETVMIKKVNDKLFIGGRPLKIYDGNQLLSTEFYGRFLNIDEEESIYNWAIVPDFGVVINKVADGKIETVGNTIQTNAIINGLEFDDDTIIVCGIDTHSTSRAFFLDSNNEWKPIVTTFQIRSLLNYKGKIIATTSDGQMMELKQN